MGKVNNVMRRYFCDKKRFADLFNGVFFKGASVIKPENLSDASEKYSESDGSQADEGMSSTTVERIRDIKMKLNTGEVLKLLALENQDQVDYTMPFRCMQYDTMEYSMQLAELKKRNEAENNYQSWAERACKVKKNDRIAPIYTICLYHGEAEWDGPRTLKDMMDFGSDSEGMSNYFVDYPIHLICINEQKNFDIFHTEIKQLFQALQFRKDKKKLLEHMENSEEYKHVDAETLETISVMVNAPSIWKEKEKYMNKNKEREEYDMCQALRELEEDGRMDGVNMMTELMRRLFSDNRVEDAKLAVSDESARNKFFEEYGIKKTLSF